MTHSKRLEYENDRKIGKTHKETCSGGTKRCSMHLYQQLCFSDKVYDYVSCIVLVSRYGSLTGGFECEGDNYIE